MAARCQSYFSCIKGSAGAKDELFATGKGLLETSVQLRQHALG